MGSVSAVAAVLAAVGLLAVASGSAGTVLATPISSDPYTNTSSQHRTQVEPDSFSFATRSSRPSRPAASRRRLEQHRLVDLDERRRDLDDRRAPGTTVYERRAVGRGSAIPRSPTTPEHDVWMISSSHRRAAAARPILTSRSTDGGLTWSNPVTVSTHRGRLRQELDRLRQHGLEPSSTATATRSGTTTARQPAHDEHLHRRRAHLERHTQRRLTIPPASAASRSSSRTGT